jgi:signal transduction histidine kinase
MSDGQAARSAGARSESTDARSESKKTRSQEHLGAWEATPRARGLSWLPLALVVLSLTGLAIAPFALQRYTRGLRQEVRRTSDPARLILGELRLGLARETALAQQYWLDRETRVWLGYHRAAARDDSLLAQLESTLQTAGAPTQAALRVMRAAIGEWRQGNAMGESTDTAAPTAPPPSDQPSRRRVRGYEDLLSATMHLETAAMLAMQDRRARVERAERLEFATAMVFVLVGCAACAGVAALTLRGGHLRDALRRRAEEEASLRHLASRLSGALTMDEVAERTVNAALVSGRIAGEHHQVPAIRAREVGAGAGTCEATTGSHVVLPEWLLDRANHDESRTFMTQVRASSGSGAKVDRHRGGASLVVPLRHDGTVIGTLYLVSVGGRRRIGESSARFGRMLGDIAAVALHRAEALDNERRARAEAEAAVRTRDTVVSIVSHDLRDPLTAIIGSADLLLELKPDAWPPEGRVQLATLRRAAQAMNRLIRDLLDVSRLAAGPLPVRRLQVQLGEVVEEVVGMFDVVARKRRLTLRCELPPTVSDVSGDRDRLAQALGNLVGNAINFTPVGGQILVRLEESAGDVRVHVSDGGPGIPEDQLPYLFEPFWKASREDSRGLGLGLAIVKAIVEAHGGRIGVESAPGHGATFSIVLPAGRAERAVRGNGRAPSNGDGRVPSNGDGLVRRFGSRWPGRNGPMGGPREAPDPPDGPV